MKTITLNLTLTEKEAELLRNSTSDLGTNHLDSVNLQLKIADALLDAGYVPTIKHTDSQDKIVDYITKKNLQNYHEAVGEWNNK